MLDLEVNPEEGLQHEHWEFLLGMHFSQAVAIVQSQVRVIKTAHVLYNDQNPLVHDLILDLPSDGLRLIFDSKAQRLKLIEVYNLKLVRLKYCGAIFNGSEVIPTVHQIDRCFGATRPGTFDKEKSVFVLSFRGLSFFFPVDSQFEPHFSHGLGSLRFPGEATPVLNRLAIYQGNNGCIAEAPVPPLPSSCFRGNVFCSECQVIRNRNATHTRGLRLKLYAQSTDALEVDGDAVHFERTIMFGESAQSVAAKLGTPPKVYYKSDDKMKIHSKEAHKRVLSDKSDYFFNYFTMGIDILFDATTNLAVKFILHTNFPGHYDFTDYHRSPFTLTLGRSHPVPISQSSLPLQQSKNFLDNLNPNPNAKQNENTEDVMMMEKAPVPSGGGGGKGKNKKKNGNGKGKNQQQNSCSASSSNSSSEKSSPPSAEELQPAVIGTTTTVVSSTSSSQMITTSSSATSVDIKWDTRWEEIRNFLWIEKAERMKLEKPVVLTRSSASNPFGPSLCYGVQDLIFEVMSNDHLATVSIYYSGPPPPPPSSASEELSLLDLTLA